MKTKKIFILTILLLSNCIGYCSSFEEVIKYQKIRESSINSFKMKYRTIFLSFNEIEDTANKPEDCEKVLTMLKDLRIINNTGSDVENYENSINSSLLNLKSYKSLNEITQKDNKYNEKMTSGDSFIEMAYNGSEYYEHNTLIKQFDIKSKQPIIQYSSLRDFAEIGLAVDKLKYIETGKILSSQNNTFIIEVDNPDYPYLKNAELHFDNNGNILSTILDYGDSTEEYHSLFYKNIDGYDTPGLTYIIRNTPSVSTVIQINIIDELEYNCEITNNDLKIGENLPPWTAIVDWRHNPPKISQNMQSLELYLDENTMLDSALLSSSSVLDTSLVDNIITEREKSAKEDVSVSNVQAVQTESTDNASKNKPAPVEVSSTNNIIYYIVAIVALFGALAGIAYLKKK